MSPEHSSKAYELLELSRKSRNIRTSHRLLAVRDVLLGDKREGILERYGVSRATLCRWLERYDAQGASGLDEVSPPGPECKLSPELRAALKRRIAAQPSYEADGVVRRRAKDVQALLEREFGVVYKTAGGVRKLLHRIGLAHLTTRPSHPNADPEAAAEFKKNSRNA